MKIRGILFLIVVAFLAACSDDSDSNPLISGDNCIRGDGAIVTETRDLPDFTTINSTIVADIFVTQGPLEPIRIEAQQNILDELETQVSINTLTISFDECVEDVDNIRIFITIPDIRALILTGVGSMNTVNQIDVDDLDINLTGVGNFNLEGTADNLNVLITGVGDVLGFSFNTDQCNINITGEGDAEVFVNNELNVTITGIGTVFYLGSPTVTSTITGTGSVIDVN